MDSSGYVYVADTSNNEVKKVSPDGDILAVYSGFNEPQALAVDDIGNIYVADTGNNTVKKISPDGTITDIDSLDPSGNYYTTDNGSFYAPTGIAVDSTGKIYVTDSDKGVKIFQQYCGVIYNGNGNSSGSAPTDGNNYVNGQSATVLGNTGSLVKNGFSFNGWNTKPDGSGTAYAAGDNINLTLPNVTLYAQWNPAPAYVATVTVNKDGSAWTTSAAITIGTDAESAAANGSALANGTYNIYANGADTGVDITVNGAAATATLNYYTLTLTAGAGIDSVSGDGIYLSGANASIDAVVSSGYTWEKWSDGNTDKPRTIQINSTLILTASATLTPTYALTITAGTGGTITAGSSGNYATGAVISLTATANSNYSFSGWTSSNGGTFAKVNSVSTTFTMPTGATALTATFTYNGGSFGGGSASSGGTTVIGSVIYGNGTQVSNVTATVTIDSNGNDKVSMNAAQTVMLKQPDGTMSSLSDLSKVAFATAAGSPVTVSADGTINLTNLAKGTDNHFNITYDLGNGQKLTIGTLEIKIDSSGNSTLTENLIDPYGIVTDAATGKALAGANVTLYYADSARNKAAGKTPDTVVALPSIAGFKPNNNQDPQTSDVNGAYGFMVFPDTDYYIVATKDGYAPYTSPTISVGQETVHWDFKMSPATTGVTRLAGENRVDTALAIAQAEYPGKIENVVLATADNYPDALAGSVLAYKLNAPILLVGSSEADQTKVLDYLKAKLDPAGTVYILGGTAAVSSAMENKVAASGFNHITRIGGADRYETSAKIADQLGVRSGTPVVLVTGENYPDGLSVSSVAAQMQMPILLVQKDGISSAVAQEIAAIKPAKVYIIGGEGAIGATVESQAAQITSLDKANIVRISGADRYETSLAVAKYFNLSGQNVCIATGNDFPDALAGSVYAANYNASIILVDKTLSDNETTYLINRKLPGATILGGEGAVSQNVQQQISELMKR